MSECERFESMLESYVASDAESQALSELLAHTKNCDACRRLLAIHGDLLAAGARVPEPDEADLDYRQARVLRDVRRRRARRPLRFAAIAAGGRAARARPPSCSARCTPRRRPTAGSRTSKTPRSRTRTSRTAGSPETASRSTST